MSKPKCKICSESNKSEFYANSISKCKSCTRYAVRANRLANIDKYKAYDKDRANRPDRVAARLKYQKTEQGIAAHKKSAVKWVQKNSIKKGASTMVGNAVRDGKLTKSYNCELCCSGGIIHGHHDDYALPLTVRWLCSTCHNLWHKENGEGLNG